MKTKLKNKKEIIWFGVHYTGAFNLWKWSSNTFTFCVLLKFILYFSKKNKNTEMKKDKRNSRESWFLLFMPENHDLHPNFIEIPFINVFKDFLYTMTLTLWDFKQWWSLPHFCVISLSYSSPNPHSQLLNRFLCFSSSTILSNIDVSGHYIQLFSLFTQILFLSNDIIPKELSFHTYIGC